MNVLMGVGWVGRVPQNQQGSVDQKTPESTQQGERQPHFAHDFGQLVGPVCDFLSSVAITVHCCLEDSVKEYTQNT